MKVTDLLEMDDRYAEDRNPMDGMDIDYGELFNEARRTGKVINTLEMLIDDIDPSVKREMARLDFEDFVSEDEYVTDDDAYIINHFVKRAAGEYPDIVAEHVKKMIAKVSFTHEEWPHIENAQEMARDAASVPDTREQDIPSREERNR